jgi:hypothetical protein
MARQDRRKAGGQEGPAPEVAPAQAAPQQQVGGGNGGRKPPLKEFRIGRIKVACWENHSAEHGAWFSFTLTRSYKQADQWKTAQSLGVDDLLVAALLLQDARRWLASYVQKPKDRQPGEDEPDVQNSQNGQNGIDIPF